jgi:hypothetical protein
VNATARTTRLTPTQERCTSGHFLQAGDTHCHVGGCESPRRPRLSLVKPIPPLARRHPVTPVTVCEAAAGRAAMAARAARIQVPVLAWYGHPDGTATARLAHDGTHLHHRDHGPTPFTAAVPCPGGSHHIHSVAGPADLDAARRATTACDQIHADFTGWSDIATRDLTAAFAAGRARVLPLHQMRQPKEA